MMLRTCTAIARFSLSSFGDDVYLFSSAAPGALSGYSHGVSFGAAQDGVSFGRHVNSVGDEHRDRPTVEHGDRDEYGDRSGDDNSDPNTRRCRSGDEHGHENGARIGDSDAYGREHA